MYKISAFRPHHVHGGNKLQLSQLYISKRPTVEILFTKPYNNRKLEGEKKLLDAFTSYTNEITRLKYKLSTLITSSLLHRVSTKTNNSIPRIEVSTIM